MVESPDGNMLVAYGHLKGPQWLLLVTFPKAVALSGSWSALASNFAGKFLIVAICAAILFGMVRRLVIRPLHALGDPKTDQAETLARRADVLGQLARTLRDERQRGDEILAGLEERVQTPQKPTSWPT